MTRHSFNYTNQLGAMKSNQMMTEEQKEKIRQKLLLYFKEHPVSSETRIKLSKISKGRIVSLETRHKLSEASKGKKRHPLTLETKRKIGDSNRGKSLSTETKQKIGASNKGRIRTEEQRRINSESQKKRFSNPSERKKLSDAHKKLNFHHSMESIRKISQALMGNTRGKGYHHTKEAKQKISEASKGHTLSLDASKKISSKMMGNKNSLGHRHSLETILKMSSSQKNHPVSLDARKKLSQINQEAWKTGKYKNSDLSKFFKNGSFYSKKNKKNLHYRSSYEQKAYYIFENLNDVLSYEPEPFSIEYVMNDGIKKFYYPDILVIYTDNTKELIEIKPASRLKEHLNILKIRAGKKFAKENNMNFIVMTEKELGITR
jgi:hypothetical protein